MLNIIIKPQPQPIFNQTIINIESDLIKIHNRQVARRRRKWIRESKKPLMEVQGVTADVAKSISMSIMSKLPSDWFFKQIEC